MNWISEKPKAWDGDVAVILAHGAGQGMNSNFMSFFHSGLAGRRYLTIKFNFNYMEIGRKVPDTQAVMQALYRRTIEEVTDSFRPRRIVIGGKSMGGRVASYIANEVPRPSGLIFLGYPLHPPGKTDQLRDAHLYAIDRPMLFISGTKDNFAERDRLQTVVDKLGKRATLRWIEEGNHSLEIRRTGSISWPVVLEAMDVWLKAL